MLLNPMTKVFEYELYRLSNCVDFLTLRTKRLTSAVTGMITAGNTLQDKTDRYHKCMLFFSVERMSKL